MVKIITKKSTFCKETLANPIDLVDLYLEYIDKELLLLSDKKITQSERNGEKFWLEISPRKIHD